MDLKILNGVVPLKRLEYTTMSSQIPITLFSTVSLDVSLQLVYLIFYT